MRQVRVTRKGELQPPWEWPDYISLSLVLFAAVYLLVAIVRVWVWG